MLSLNRVATAGLVVVGSQLTAKGWVGALLDQRMVRHFIFFFSPKGIKGTHEYTNMYNHITGKSKIKMPGNV
jgi:hypothetical protein